MFKDRSFIIGLLFGLGLLYLTNWMSHKPQEITAHNFVGKWQSSKLATPLYMHENGEWEIKLDGQKAMQYGVWQYQNNQIIWSIRMGGRAQHDPNPVISVKPDQFQLKEADGSVTTFNRLSSE